MAASGISANAEVLGAFRDAVSNNGKRLLKMSIDGESIVLSAQLDVAADWEADFSMFDGLLDENTPAYIVYRTDAPGTDGTMGWIFFAYVPDNALVRHKMLYASTRASLKKQLGEGKFVDEMYSNHKGDFTLESYKLHKASTSAAAPLTEREEEKSRMLKDEAHADIGTGSKKAHVHGVAFPVSNDAQAQLRALAAGSINYVQLSLNVTAETVNLEKAASVDASSLNSECPANSPRYHFFKYKHAFEDNTHELIIFVYSCPQTSAVKERMLYSSCKATVVAAAQDCGLVIYKASEISDGAEFTEKFVMDELHPPPPDEKKVFKKPVRSGVRAGGSVRSRNAAVDES